MFAQLVLFAVAVAGANSEDPTRQLENVRGRLALLPTELESHFLLQLVEKGWITSADERRRILEQVFVDARNATYPYRIVLSEPINPRGGSDVGLLDYALQPGIDALSLRSRAVILMVPENRKRAREMLEDLSLASPPPLSCRDGFGYSTGVYWEALAAVVERAWSAEEIRNARHLALAEHRLRSTRSGFDLMPAMRFLTTVRVSDEDRSVLTRAFAGMVGRLTVDPRTLQVSVDSRWITAAVELCRSVPKAEAVLLARALREYLARGTSALLCQESFATRYPGQGLDLNSLLSQFNETILPFGDDSLPRIDPALLPPQRDTRLTGGAGSVREFWDTPASMELLRELKRLRYGGPEDRASIEALPARKGANSNPLPEEKRLMIEWQNRADTYLAQVQRWRETSKEDARVLAHQTCVIYTALLDTLPPGPVRETVTVRYARLLETEVAPVVTAPEWFHHILDFMEKGTTGGQDRSALLAVLEQQGGRGAAFAAYVRLTSDTGR